MFLIFSGFGQGHHCWLNNLISGGFWKRCSSCAAVFSPVHIWSVFHVDVAATSLPDHTRTASLAVDCISILPKMISNFFRSSTSCGLHGGRRTKRSMTCCPVKDPSQVQEVSQVREVNFVPLLIFSYGFKELKCLPLSMRGVQNLFVKASDAGREVPKKLEANKLYVCPINPGNEVDPQALCYLKPASLVGKIQAKFKKVGFS